MGAKPADRTASDLRGWSRLITAAAIGVTNLTEQTHLAILRMRPFGAPVEGSTTTGVTGFVYRCVRGTMRLSGAAVDAGLAQIGLPVDEAPASPGRDALLAALNGVVGDYLDETGNPLALTMRLRQHGQALEISTPSLLALKPTGRIAVLVHGLCMSDLRWGRSGRDHGDMLAQMGFTPVYLLYNSGLHISANGRAAAEMLENLVAQWPTPIDDLVIVGHSMGGLVARSACYYGEIARHDWRRRLGKLFCLGSPHHGAPLERIGAWVEAAIGKIPYGAAFTGLGRIRSAGVTDLRFGNLLDEDWLGRDRFARDADVRIPVPLPENVACYAIAATTAPAAGGVKDRLIGDGLVTVDSALGRHRDPARDLAFPPQRQWIACGMNHFDLLDRAEVGQQIERWLAA